MKTVSIRAEWEGQLIDGRFALLEWLGGTDDRGVFLTVLQGIQKATIKLIPAEGEDADSYIAQWEAARRLSHPYLIAVLETGRFSVADTDLVYVVTEYAEKSLSQVITERAISGGEARGVFDPVLDALSYLHVRGFVHGHVKPSNILMVADQWKLSGDDLLVAGEFPDLAWIPGGYDAPEAVDGSISAAMDTWSVGMTLAEALTQHPVAWDWAAKSLKSEPTVPALPRPFGEIVRECLRTDPAQRSTTGEVKSLLQRAWTSPTVVEAISAGAGLARMEAESMRSMAEPAQAAAKPKWSAAEGPTPPVETPMPVAAQPIWAEEEPALPVRAARRFEREEPSDEREPVDFDRSPTLFADIEEANLTGFPKIPLVIGVLVVLAFAAAFLVKTGRIPWPLWPLNAPTASRSVPQPQAPGTPPSSSASRLPTGEAPPPSESQGAAPGGNEGAAATGQAAPEKPQRGATPETQPQGAVPETRTKASTKREGENAPATGRSTPPQPASSSETRRAPATGQTAPEPKAPESHVVARASAEGGVADRVVPTVPEGARQSMRGPREAVVQVFVDQNGRVSNAAYASQGPGNFFARTAMRAAREWKFNPPIRGGRPQPSVWRLRFSFLPGRPEASVTVERH